MFMCVMEEFSLLIDSMRLLPPNNSVVHIFFKLFLSILFCKIEYYFPAIFFKHSLPHNRQKGVDRHNIYMMCNLQEK